MTWRKLGASVVAILVTALLLVPAGTAWARPSRAVTPDGAAGTTVLAIPGKALDRLAELWSELVELWSPEAAAKGGLEDEVPPGGQTNEGPGTDPFG